MTPRLTVLAVILFLGLAGLLAFLGHRTADELRSVVTDQFNQQQLVLAKEVAEDFTRSLDRLGRAMTALAGPRGPSRETLFVLFEDIGLVALGRAQGAGDQAPLFLEGRNGEDLSALAALSPPRPNGEDGLRLGPTFRAPDGPHANRRLTLLSKPAGADPADGLVLALLDAQTLATRISADVRSGSTGFCWVIDEQSHYLAHPYPDFPGMPAVEARLMRDVGVGTSEAVHLVRDVMPKGLSGIGHYTAGWHLGRTGIIEKLVGFAPVDIPVAGPQPRFWSVAVVAPAEEIGGIIGKLVYSQALVMAVIQATVFIALVLAIHGSLRFSKVLRREVERKTQEVHAAQESLMAAERLAAVGRTAAKLSHEIRNPLTVIAGFASQVRRACLQDDPKNAEKLDIVVAEARRLDAMLTEVRDFSRPNPPRFAEADLAIIGRETARLFADEASHRGVSLDAATPESLLAVVDEARIRQSLLNLVKNALEATPAGGRVLVTVGLEDDMALLEVADTGPGIAPEERARILEPFYTTKEKGTGLGLAVVARVTDEHRGRLVIDSQPRQGTSFRLYLPLRGPGRLSGDSGQARFDEQKTLAPPGPRG